MKSDWNTQWNEEYTIENTILKLKIKLAGNTENGIIQYIERLGFFEGGSTANDYRIDPTILMAILTGKVTEQALSLIKQKQKLLLKVFEDEISFCESRWNEIEKISSKDKKLEEEAEWLQQRIKDLNSKISEQEESSKQIITHLQLYQ